MLTQKTIDAKLLGCDDSSETIQNPMDRYLNLMKSVLATAISDINRYLSNADKLGQMSNVKLKREINTNYSKTLVWIKSNDRKNIFSFLNICNYLEYDPERCRRKFKINVSEINNPKIKPNHAKNNINDIVDNVCSELGVSFDEIKSRNHKLNVIKARHKLSYELYKSGYCIAEVARILNKTRFTARYGIKKHGKLNNNRQEYEKEVVLRVLNIEAGICLETRAMTLLEELCNEADLSIDDLKSKYRGRITIWKEGAAYLLKRKGLSYGQMVAYFWKDKTTLFHLDKNFRRKIEQYVR